MADAQSRYVKLKKDQAPLEDIQPGELNQPIDVPQVSLSLKTILFFSFFFLFFWIVLREPCCLEF